MTRDATAAVLTEVVKPVIRVVNFVELDYPTGFVRVNSSDRNISFDSGSGIVTFLGVAQLGSISSAGETRNLQASSVSLTLNGIPSNMISLAFEKAQGRAGKIWIGFLDSQYTLIADPVLYFLGLIDNSKVILGDTGSVTVTLNNRFILWQREKVRRYTDQDQQAQYPGDKFFEFINQAVEKEIIWGPGGPEPVNAPPPSQSMGSRSENNSDLGSVSGSTTARSESSSDSAELRSEN